MSEGANSKPSWDFHGFPLLHSDKKRTYVECDRDFKSGPARDRTLTMGTQRSNGLTSEDAKENHSPTTMGHFVSSDAVPSRMGRWNGKWFVR